MTKNCHIFITLSYLVNPLTFENIMSYLSVEYRDILRGVIVWLIVAIGVNVFAIFPEYG